MDEDPEFNVRRIPVKSSVNRLISLWNSPIVAAWHENGDFSIYNVEGHENNEEKIKKGKKNFSKNMIQTFKNS